MAILTARTEFSSALNQVCTERHIDPEVVLETIKSAILAAYRKDYGFDEEKEHQVEVDPATGSAKIFTDGKEVTPPGFGRIAAQTAKQVILQKIREAEKASIIDEYSKKVGTIINAMVLRFDPPFIVLDIGRGQGLMPREEQIHTDKYSLNRRLIVYIVEIRNTHKGDAIIVSRAHPNLVTELFRREVPEVSSGAVEIRTIAREAGSRSKVAVASTQAGVDPVGSCVGQKGIRVQAVIRELDGEKIDIIPHTDNTEEMIKAALSPAEGAKVTLNKKKKTARVAFPEEQLSLAIGKSGQNVRLASKLTGYKIDIVADSIAAKKAKPKTTKNAADKKITPQTKIEQTTLLEKIKKALAAAGLKTCQDLTEKSDEDLLAIKGLGPKALEKIHKIVKSLDS